jgi:lysophospholipase L1-like esterase
MRFGRVDEVRIPQGSANRIRYGDKVLWSLPLARYVSLGDSIAAGHAINADWGKDYGTGSQYGENGRKETVIVPNCYTDLIRRDLAAKYNGKITAISFAHSGDTVADLMKKLTHEAVVKAIKRSTLVTVCIGANDVLQPALSGLGGYINTGNVNDIAADVNSHLATLNNDSAPTSYKALFDRLIAINPKAQYVFTTIYNPYKYLWIEESTEANNYKDGFFGPLMWAIPDFPDWMGGDALANAIRGTFYNTAKVQDTIHRVNAIGGLSEGFVTRLNDILRSKINAYGNSNIMLADTKALFDTVPDRPIPAEKHYNDLVNVEPTRGYVVQDLDWGQFWAGVDWWNAASNVDKIAETVVNAVIDEVILPDVDPHPEEYGHEVMKTSFESCYTPGVYSRRVIT